jgi:hypothetical protein
LLKSENGNIKKGNNGNNNFKPILRKPVLHKLCSNAFIYFNTKTPLAAGFQAVDNSA